MAYHCNAENAWEKNIATTSELRTVFRAAVGAASLGIEELTNHARAWDEDTANEQAAAVDECLEREAEIKKDVTGRTNDPKIERCAYMLIGFTLEAADTAMLAAKRIDRLQQDLRDTVIPYIEVLAENGFGNRIYEMSLVRFDNSIARWTEVGRREHARGRAIAKKALSELASTGISTFADSPEVREMVKSQSTGIAMDAVDTVRQQTEAADLVVERIARKLFGRKPRSTED